MIAVVFTIFISYAIDLRPIKIQYVIKIATSEISNEKKNRLVEVQPPNHTYFAVIEIFREWHFIEEQNLPAISTYTDISFNGKRLFALNHRARTREMKQRHAHVVKTKKREQQNSVVFTKNHGIFSHVRKLQGIAAEVMLFAFLCLFINFCCLLFALCLTHATTDEILLRSMATKLRALFYTVLFLRTLLIPLYIIIRRIVLVLDGCGHHQT